MVKPFRFTYRAQVIINKKKDLVWEVLTDLDNYHRWNPFTPKVVTNWKIGELVTLTVQMKKGKAPIIQKEYVTKYRPKDEFAWGMQWRFLLKAERVQKLSTTADGKTVYFTQDIIEGFLSPTVHILYGKFIQSGFKNLALALKKHMEK